MSLKALLKEKKLLIVCGTGGVGKTTLSATCSLLGSLSQKNTLVLTMDPAKRLATALGLKHLGDEPQNLTSQIQSLFPKKKLGNWYALMPDAAFTFEHFVRSLTPNPQHVSLLIQNPIFQILAQEFSGANEYMALQKVYALAQDPRFELIILDTPPSRHMLSFLQAPQLLNRFFQEKWIQWLMAPTQKIFSKAVQKTLKLLGKLTSTSFMQSLHQFAAAMFELQTAFSTKLDAVSKLLHAHQTAFLLVSTPNPDCIDQIHQLERELQTQSIHLSGILYNRTLHTLTSPFPKDSASQRLLQSLILREKQTFRALSHFSILGHVPELVRDVHSVEDIAHVATILDPSLRPLADFRGGSSK